MFNIAMLSILHSHYLTYFFYKNNFIRTKALVLAKKLRTSYEQARLAVSQNIRTKSVG